MEKVKAAFELEFGFRVARVVRRLRQTVASKLGAYRLTELTWRSLAYVDRLAEGVRQSDLACALGIEGPWLMPLPYNRERRRLIERRSKAATGAHAAAT